MSLAKEILSMPAFNRTIQELKSETKILDEQMLDPFNRTIQELKYKGRFRVNRP